MFNVILLFRLIWSNKDLNFFYLITYVIDEGVVDFSYSWNERKRMGRNSWRPIFWNGLSKFIFIFYINDGIPFMLWDYISFYKSCILFIKIDKYKYLNKSKLFFFMTINYFNLMRSKSFNKLLIYRECDPIALVH